MRKVITHNGIFHADDVMSIALIKEQVGEIPVERTRNISTDDINDPEVWVVDVGLEFNHELNNYDHHQSKELDASCILVLKALTYEGLIRQELYEELQSSFETISFIDCNGPQDMNGFQFNTLIKSFNALENGFDLAVDVCRKYIQSCKATVQKSVQSQEIWDRGEKISMFIRLCDAFPIHWKRYEEEIYLIYPNDGKWTVLTRSSHDFPVWDTGKADFIHQGRFIAVFSDKEDAIQCAQMSACNVVG